MQDMMTILQIYCVQRIGPANPHWAIYYFKAIVHNPNQVIIYVKNASFKTINPKKLLTILGNLKLSSSSSSKSLS